MLVGVKGSYALENRAAIGAHHAAVLTREQSEDSLSNFVQTVQVDVRTQYSVKWSTRPADRRHDGDAHRAGDRPAR